MTAECRIYVLAAIVIATVGKHYIHGVAFLMVLSAFVRLRTHRIEPNQGFAAA